MTRRSRLVYEGRVIKVHQERRRLPNGVTTDLDVVRHPGAVLIIPFLSKDRVILLRQFRPVLNRYLYELPAGTIDEGEMPLACARREIIEETGYKAARMTRLGVIYPVPGYSTEKISIFKAEGLKKAEAEGDSDEIIESFPAARSRIKALFEKGALCDAKTIAAFVFCGWL